MKIKLSMNCYQNGEFDLFIEDAESDMRICVTGKQTFTEAQHDWLMEAMPACVMTRYEKE